MKLHKLKVSYEYYINKVAGKKKTCLLLKNKGYEPDDLITFNFVENEELHETLKVYRIKYAMVEKNYGKDCLVEIHEMTERR